MWPRVDGGTLGSGWGPEKGSHRPTPKAGALEKWGARPGERHMATRSLARIPPCWVSQHLQGRIWEMFGKQPPHLCPDGLTSADLEATRRPGGGEGGGCPGDLRPRDTRGLSRSLSPSLRLLWGAGERKQTGSSREWREQHRGSSRPRHSASASYPPLGGRAPHPAAEPRRLCPGCLGSL